MYIKYSTRRFKEDHLNRIRALKNTYASQGVDKTQEQILVEVVEEGLKIVEQTPDKKRIAPMWIRDE